MNVTLPVYLLVFWLSSSGMNNNIACEFPSMELCNESIKNGSFNVSNEDKNLIFAICVPKKGKKYTGITYNNPTELNISEADNDDIYSAYMNDDSQ